MRFLVLLPVVYTIFLFILSSLTFYISLSLCLPVSSNFHNIILRMNTCVKFSLAFATRKTPLSPFLLQQPLLLFHSSTPSTPFLPFPSPPLVPTTVLPLLSTLPPPPPPSALLTPLPFSLHGATSEICLSRPRAVESFLGTPAISISSGRLFPQNIKS